MAGRFVRASKYRHVFGKSTRKEFCYDNLHISRNAWDTNLVKVNPEFISVNWESSGGGAFAVIPLGERGKAPDQIPLFRGHTAAVLDTDWHPFNDHVLASASDDGKVFIWQVPRGFTLLSEGGSGDPDSIEDVAPAARLTGHSRKVGQVLFNPSAENVLASASGDLTIRLWDVTTGQARATLKHADIVQSLSWSADGSTMATSSRDKKLRVWDVRQERAVHEFAGHTGAKNSRVVWLGEHNRFATTGFSRMSERQLALWEPGRKDPIGGFTMLDSISGVCMPFWDDGSNCLYLAGKGDGNIRYFEYENDKFEFLSEYKSADPQRGVAFVPRRGVNVHENEVMRAYKTVNDTYIEPISFTVPRRAETFQSDIYPPATGIKPAMSAKEFFDGKNGLPPKIDFESIYEGNAPVEVPSDYKPPSAAPTPKEPEFTKSEPPRSAATPARTPTTATEQRQTQRQPPAATKLQDRDESDDDDDETSSFEEITKPAARAPVSSAKSPPSPVKSPQQPIQTRGPVPTAVSTSSAAAASTSLPPTPSSSSVEASLTQIKQLLEAQTKIISAQSDKLSHLAGEVDTLKKKISSGSHDQSERIRQLELELEAARS